MAIGMDPRGAVVHLKHDAMAPLPTAMTETQPTQGVAQWLADLEQGKTDEPMQVDWLVAVFPQQPAALGNSDPQAAQWAEDATALADALAERCGLRAAAFLAPDRWPTVSGRLSQTGPSRRLWSHHECVLRNASHEGRIETDHHLVCSLPPGVGKYFSIPDATVDEASPMLPALDQELAPVDAIPYGQLRTTRLYPNDP